jgi:hypothetical protein
LPATWKPVANTGAMRLDGYGVESYLGSGNTACHPGLQAGWASRKGVILGHRSWLLVR